MLLSAAACILLDSLRRQVLSGTELAHAHVDTIHLKLLSIRSRVVRSAQRVGIHLTEGHPLKDLLAPVPNGLRAATAFSAASS